MPRVLGSALRPSYASSVALATSAVSPTRRLKKRRTMKKADDGLELCCRVVRRHLRSALFTLLRHAVMKHAATKSSPAACDTCARGCMRRDQVVGVDRLHLHRVLHEGNHVVFDVEEGVEHLLGYSFSHW